MNDVQRQSAILIEEAYSLALAGRNSEALRLLDEVEKGSALDDAPPGTVALARARVLASHARPEGGREALRVLEELSARADGARWRLALERSRVSRREGAVTAATTHLKEALDHFRSEPEASGPFGPALSAYLTREAEDLQRHSAETPGARPKSSDATLPAAASLIRLVEMGRRLATEADPEQVLRIVLHEAIEMTGAARGFLVLVQGDDYEFALAENLDRSDVEQPSFQVSRTLIRRVMAERKPVVIRVGDESGSAAEAGTASIHQIGARSIACIPVTHAEAILGVLYVDARDPSHAFGTAAGGLLELFAGQAGAALENARARRAQTVALQSAEETIRRQRSESQVRSRYRTLIGSSRPMQEVYRKLDLFTPTELPVLVLGETGTGKELVARLIHSGGPRAERAFVATNCAGLAESMLESELFGHERGAFTGADRSRPGLFELAHRGTLFLDEVGDMSPRMQGDLLRALQSGEVRRVGGRETIRVDVRVIAATHRDLEEMIRLGQFRQDLYFRLNVLALQLPPLRERPDDVPLLADELTKGFVTEGRTQPAITDGAMRRLMAYSWPGNVRELENVLQRASVLGEDVIEESHLPAELLRSGSITPPPGSLKKAEEAAVRKALAAAKGNKTEAARILGVDRNTLAAKLKRFHTES